MTRTVEDLAFERRKYRDELSAALTKMEGLYRIIYGYAELGEKPSGNQAYIAEQYVLQTRRALADENGWTGRKCPVCAGHGVNNENHGCASCGGTATRTTANYHLDKHKELTERLEAAMKAKYK